MALAMLAALSSATALTNSGSYSPSMAAVGSVMTQGSVYTVGNNGGLISVRKFGAATAHIDYNAGSTVTNVAIAADSGGNVYTIGTKGTTYSVSKFDAQLNRLWTVNKTTGGTVTARDVVVTNDGATVVALSDYVREGISHTIAATLNGSNGSTVKAVTFSDTNTHGARLGLFNNGNRILMTNTFTSGSNQYIRFRELSSALDTIRTYDHNPKTGLGADGRGGAWSLENVVIGANDEITFTAANATANSLGKTYLVRISPQAARGGPQWAVKWYHRDGIAWRGAKSRVEFAVDDTGDVYAAAWLSKMNYPTNTTELARPYLVYAFKNEDGRAKWLRTVYDAQDDFGGSDANLGGLTASNDEVRFWWRETSGGGNEFVATAKFDSLGKPTVARGPVAFTPTPSLRHQGPYGTFPNAMIPSEEGYAVFDETL